MNKLELIEPNEAEKKNGWTAESLTKYVHDARARQSAAIGVQRKPPLQRANGYRWQFPARGRR